MLDATFTLVLDPSVEAYDTSIIAYYVYQLSSLTASDPANFYVEVSATSPIHFYTKLDGDEQALLDAVADLSLQDWALYVGQPVAAFQFGFVGAPPAPMPAPAPPILPPPPPPSSGLLSSPLLQILLPVVGALFGLIILGFIVTYLYYNGPWKKKKQPAAAPGVDAQGRPLTAAPPPPMAPPPVDAYGRPMTAAVDAYGRPMTAAAVDPYGRPMTACAPPPIDPYMPMDPYGAYPPMMDPYGAPMDPYGMQMDPYGMPMMDPYGAAPPMGDPFGMQPPSPGGMEDGFQYCRDRLSRKKVPDGAIETALVAARGDAQRALPALLDHFGLTGLENFDEGAPRDRKSRRDRRSSDDDDRRRRRDRDRHKRRSRDDRGRDRRDGRRRDSRDERDSRSDYDDRHRRDRRSDYDDRDRRDYDDRDRRDYDDRDRRDRRDYDDRDRRDRRDFDDRDNRDRRNFDDRDRRDRDDRDRHDHDGRGRRDYDNRDRRDRRSDHDDLDARGKSTWGRARQHMDQFVDHQADEYDEYGNQSMGFEEPQSDFYYQDEENAYTDEAPEEYDDEGDQYSQYDDDAYDDHDVYDEQYIMDDEDPPFYPEMEEEAPPPPPPKGKGWGRAKRGYSKYEVHGAIDPPQHQDVTFVNRGRKMTPPDDRLKSPATPDDAYVPPPARRCTTRSPSARALAIDGNVTTPNKPNKSARARAALDDFSDGSGASTPLPPDKPKNRLERSRTRNRVAPEPPEEELQVDNAPPKKNRFERARTRTRMLAPEEPPSSAGSGGGFEAPPPPSAAVTARARLQRAKSKVNVTVGGHRVSGRQSVKEALKRSGTRSLN